MDENTEKEYPVKNMLKGKERRTDERKLYNIHLFHHYSHSDYLVI